ncbi:MAG: DNA polymerase IV [Clostridiales bacterium]|nr:DNA polymerase IV [Candidatus Apopatousia equi]
MRDILHCDLNNFYASCECLNRPELKNLPVAVCGSQKERHGIVLAKNMVAKNLGIKTGMSNFEALKICKNLVIFTPDFEKYIKYSSIVRSIYLKYTDMVEPFGIDECWLDITHSKIFGTPFDIAEKIRKEVFNTTGLTISVGVSFNKIFAKIGSDYKKPNAITVITKENYKDIVWKLKIEDMLGVGSKTKQKLNKMGIFTIGELANVDKDFLIKKFKKWGEYLYNYANGLDSSPVENYYQGKKVKSVGNSTTYYKDLTNEREVLIGLSTLCDSITERLIRHGINAPKTLHLSIKNSNLETISKQTKISPTINSNALCKFAFKLFKEMYSFDLPVRKLGISVSNFTNSNHQLSFFENNNKENNKNQIDITINQIKQKYGKEFLTHGNFLYDKKLGKPFDHDILDINYQVKQ